MPTRYTSLATKLGATVGGILTVVGVTLGTPGFFDTSVSEPVFFSTGGLLPMTANLTESNFEGDGTASGWSIQNPYDEAILCDRVVLRTVTAPTDGTTIIVMDVGTGTFASGASSGNTLLDNYTLAAETKTASGTRVAYASGYQKAFVLDAAGGTTDYITLGAQSGTGGGFVADFHANCYSLD